jgi:hypothetical protein
MQVRLTQQEVEYIRDLTEFDYDGSCLCMNCLVDLQAHYRSVYQTPAHHV